MSLLGAKLGASSTNVMFTFVATAPVYFLYGLNTWRVSCIILFFLYSLLLRRRCLGQMVARTYQNKPTGIVYAVLYTGGFATWIYWVWFPFDLLLVNGLLVQMPLLLVFGNTLHGLTTKTQTMTEWEYFYECIALKGECPDCRKHTLVRSGAFTSCRSCKAAFTGETYIQRCAACAI